MVSKKPYNLKPSKRSRRKSKRRSKRIKREPKFNYDLDELNFTMGPVGTLNLRRLKNHKKIRIRNAKKADAEKETKRKEKEEQTKRKEKEARKEEKFQKASQELLAHRDLFVKSKFLEKEETCSICLRNFNQRFVWKLSCNHYFHYNCIEKWSNMERYTCPLCRQEYYHP